MMEIKVGNILDFVFGHEPDCAIVQRTPLTVCAAMVESPEKYGLDKTVECTCGKGGAILGISRGTPLNIASKECLYRLPKQGIYIDLDD